MAIVEIQGKVHHRSEEGVAAEHPPPRKIAHPVAPSNADDPARNTIKAALIPRACWKIEDICFDFDSAFVKANAKKPIEKLAKLYKELDAKKLKAPISIFGHADPVGNDKYNKKLSEERAQALYGMLTRNVKKWEEIFKDRRDVAYLQQQLADAGVPGDDPSGEMGEATRATIRMYMDNLCGDFKLEDSDFLGEGTCAYQGCSEFNPVRMFSQQQQVEYRRAKAKTARNEENQPNRRVVAYLFMPGTTMNRTWWPCSTAKEAIEKCTKRFWSDARKRRKFQTAGREYRQHSTDSKWVYTLTKDTFACRFYERLANMSPCEFLRLPPVLLGIEHCPGDSKELSYKQQIETRERDAGGRVLDLQKSNFRTSYDQLKRTRLPPELFGPDAAEREKRRKAMVEGKTFEEYYREWRAKVTHILKLEFRTSSKDGKPWYALRAWVVDAKSNQELFHGMVEGERKVDLSGKWYKTSPPGKKTRIWRPADQTQAPGGKESREVPPSGSSKGIGGQIDDLYNVLRAKSKTITERLQKMQDAEMRAKLKAARR